MAVGVFSGFYLRAPFGPAVISSIAVMPFVNASGNPDLEYLSDGITETLMGSLSQVPNLSVKARSSVFRYKGKETNPQTVGRELDVQALLNGRVVQRGADLILYLELVDARTGNLIGVSNTIVNRPTWFLCRATSRATFRANSKSNCQARTSRS